MKLCVYGAGAIGGLSVAAGALGAAGLGGADVAAGANGVNGADGSAGASEVGVAPGASGAGPHGAKANGAGPHGAKANGAGTHGAGPAASAGTSVDTPAREEQGSAGGAGAAGPPAPRPVIRAASVIEAQHARIEQRDPRLVEMRLHPLGTHDQ